MKVSYNWVQEYVDFDLPPIEELAAKIGSQLGEVKEVVNLGAKYQGIVVARIVSCRAVEDSDHLNLCLIDDGGTANDIERDENGLVQVVCGAPNVREGLLVAWLPPGSTVPSSFDKDPFVLGARKLRGYVSNGMLASPAELAIGDNHDGILEIDLPCEPGANFAKLYGLDDYIVDIENKMFTHRPDCFGILGVAREISGILGKPFTEPDWFKTVTGQLDHAESNLPLVIKNQVPQLVPRFMAVALSDITIAPSSIKIQAYLSKVGVRPISNIVDLTNYFMFLTGQPLHAYDYDKVRALDGNETATLIARLPHEDEKLTLLNGKEIQPREEAIMIATESQAIGLGGVMGGASTEIDSTTKNIILECATFEMYSIRKTSMTHGIFSEAVTRFNKGQSPYQNDRVLYAIVQAISEVAGAKVASEVIDNVAPTLDTAKSVVGNVSVQLDFIMARLGVDLSAATVISLLQNVGFTVDEESTENATHLNVGVPFWRTDIAIGEDIVEEVGRLYGFDNLELKLQSRNIMPAAKNQMLDFKSDIRSILSAAGANEALTYSFVHGNLVDKLGQRRQQSYKLTNALSPELQYFRQSLAPSLLEKVHANVRAGYDQFAIFELGKTHQFDPSNNLDDGDILENDSLALVITADDKAAKQFDGAPYFQVRKYLDVLLSELNIAGLVSFEAMQDGGYYEVGRSASILAGATIVGGIGEYSQAVRKSLKLPNFTAGFEIDTAKLLELRKTHSSYQVLSKFPRVDQDICLRVPVSVSYGQLLKTAVETLTQSIADGVTYQIRPVDIYQKADDQSFKQITFRISLSDSNKTMTDQEVSKLLDGISQSAKDMYSAERI